MSSYKWPERGMLAQAARTSVCAVRAGGPSDCPPVLVLTLMMLVVVYFSVSIFSFHAAKGVRVRHTWPFHTRAGPKTLNPTPGKLDKRPGKAEDFGQKGNTVSQVITRPHPHTAGRRIKHALHTVVVTVCVRMNPCASRLVAIYKNKNI